MHIQTSFTYRQKVVHVLRFFRQLFWLFIKDLLSMNSSIAYIKQWRKNFSMLLKVSMQTESLKTVFFENQNSHVSIISSIQKNVMFLGLPDRIARIFINLIENAVSFAGENGQVRVTLKKSWRHGITITIEDSGSGVPEASRADIFERFFSSREGSAVRENSSGLGLYICKQVVEAHEGAIEVLDSDALGGAMFRVHF